MLELAARPRALPLAHGLSPTSAERSAIGMLGDIMVESFCEDWLAQTQRMSVHSPSRSNLLVATQLACDAAREGQERLLRTPALTAEPFAALLFEHHDGMCFWSAPVAGMPDRVGVLYTYFGPRIWEFNKAFSAYGAVLLRGRGCTGPWAATRSR